MIDWPSLAQYQTLFAAVIAVVGGAWALRRHHARREHDPRIQFRVGVRFIGHHEGHWIVELLAFVQNRGEVPHRMNGLGIELRGFRDGDPVIHGSEEIRGQLPFSHLLVHADGGLLSMMPDRKDARVVLYPGTSMRYMYVTSVEDSVRFLLIHGRLTREDAQALWADRVVRVPAVEGSQSEPMG